MASLETTRALRRLRNQLALLSGPAADGDDAILKLQFTASENDTVSYKAVTLGDITIQVSEACRKDLIPSLKPAEPYGMHLEVPELLRHLRWMFQKAKLGQDMFLLGPPGPIRRWIAFRFCQLTKREVEYLALTRDTTESDIKQRREIRQGSVKYIDQVAVRAAVHGRVLILEGLEKCERNVLPVLNNLLENREMHLEDGRFLVSPKRYAQIAKTHTEEQLKALGLVPVHPRFQVIALGLPVPRFEGNPLDPPLRSRFQARNINAMAPESQLAIIRHLYPSVDAKIVQKIVSFSEALARMQSLSSGGAAGASDDSSIQITKMLALPPTAAVDVARILEKYPNADIRDILTRIYPFEARPDETEVVAIRSALAALGLLLPVDVSGAGTSQAASHIELPLNSFERPQNINGLTGAAESDLFFVLTDESQHILDALLQDDQVGFDICIVAEQGSGKTRLVQKFAQSRARATRTMQMYRDMTARDLLQRRATDAEGNTVWINSPLVNAAIQGGICILDGVHRLGPGTLAVLQQLVHDRQAQLCDGRVLTANYTDENFEQIVPIHPQFRIIALATPPTKIGRGQWLSSEIGAMFHFHLLRDTSVAHKLAILDRVFPQMRINFTSRKLGGPIDPALGSDPMFRSVSALIKFLRLLESSRLKSLPTASKDAAGSQPLASVADNAGSELPKVSLRQLVRICRRVSIFPDDLAEALENTMLFKFLPVAVRDVVVQMLEHAGVIKIQKEQEKLYLENLEHLKIVDSGDIITIGSDNQRISPISVQKHRPRNPALVPRITFFEIPNHIRILREMLKDLKLHEHILLIGNQGVGKNILTDRLLEILHLEREYIQLHRDTTVQTLTLSPSIQQGVIVWEDSPLVRAVTEGRVLVIDEADKAPLEVVCVLKGLIEDGEMLLSDGRRILHPAKHPKTDAHAQSIIWVHTDFRMIVLANRPGYPFLGNNFFRECGDCFAVHVVDNPDSESEMRLLRSYAPNVDPELLSRLISLFSDLREMVDRGVLTYPYSLRELVNIAKHIQAFPGDSLSASIDNVFHFDLYDSQLREHLAQVFHRHGVPLAAGDLFKFEARLAEARSLPEAVLTETMCVTNLSPEDEVRHDLRDIMLEEKGTIKLAVTQALPVRSRIQGRIQTFTEERFSWRLDVSGHPESMVITPDGHIAVLTSQPLQLVIFPPKNPNGGGAYTQYRVIALGEHLTTFVRTPESASLVASNSSTLAALEDNTVVIFVSTFNMILKIDFHNVFMVAYELQVDPDQKANRMFGIFNNKIYIDRNVKRTVQRENRVSSSSFDLRMIDSLAGACSQLIFVRNVGNDIFIVDFKKGRQVHARLSVPILSFHPLDSNTFFLRSRNETWFQVKLNPYKSALEIVTIESKASQEASKLAQERGLLMHSFISSKHESTQTVLNSSYSYAQICEPSLFKFKDLANIYSFLRPTAMRRETSFQPQHHTPPTEREGRLIHSQMLVKSRQLVNLCFVPPVELDIDADPRLRKSRREEANLAAHWTLELVDLQARTLRRIQIDARETGRKTVLDAPMSQHSQWTYFSSLGNQLSIARVTAVREHPNGDIIILFDDGMLSVYEVDPSSIMQQLQRWKTLMGLALPAEASNKDPSAAEKDRLRLTFEYDGGSRDSRDLKVGKLDPQNKPHVGGNTFAGGTGGAGTAGSGGRSGPFRLTDGNDIYQVSQAEKDNVSREVTAAAREMAKKALAERMAAINMSEAEHVNYEQMMGAISQDIRQLRAVLDAAQAKSRERTWLKLETQGELDENRLVDGITGERNVYKRRGRENPYHGMMQEKPKRLRFVMDISGSMYRFNTEDKRLNRLLEVTLLIMEALQGFEWKYQYSIVGHSGDAADALFVDYGKPPKNAKERMMILEKMIAHSQHCGTGDNTVKATEMAIRDVVKEDADEYFVFVFSDANLSRYSISTETLSKKLTADPRVNSFIIFIASLADEAVRIKAEMPMGKAYVCLDTATLPFTFKQIFMSTTTHDV